ncbi:hypothetical protein NA56DRAFT_543155, partial [Hyaloscypha hepaticicola]
RGTSNILQSCLITTSLCVWTAVHLNIPEQDDPSFLWISYQTWRKLGWLIIGLLAPEMLVYAAYITHEDKEKKGKGTKIEEKTEVTRHPSHPWTLVQGFYAQMGGFVLDSTGVYPDFLPESHSESPLFSNSKICQGLDISRSYISDKSNASGLAKAMVCIQALWFCIQALSRVLRSLPITLLELNTFAHSLCALLIYILWWHKPLDVE